MIAAAWAVGQRTWAGSGDASDSASLGTRPNLGRSLVGERLAIEHIKDLLPLLLIQ
jgi:hypothetical protein